MSKKGKKSGKYRLKLIGINLLIFLLLMETGSAVLIRVFHMADPPYFTRIRFQNYQVADIDPHFGIWHIPNSVFKKTTTCYKVKYTFNSDGARDIERSRHSSKPRIVFLGDSFVEGWGLNDDNRMSNLLEKWLGQEVLNFGTAGYFGTTQMALLYENLAMQFDHTIVLTGLFPDNDFDDNSLAYGKKYHYYQYRPYRVKDANGNYQLKYFVDKLENSSWYPPNIKVQKITYIKGILKMTHTGMILNKIHDQHFLKKTHIPPEKPKFRVFTADELDLLAYDLLQIRKKAGHRRMYITAFPGSADFEDAFNNPDWENRLGPALDSICCQHGMTYIDIFNPLLKKYNRDNYQNLFLDCDPHYSPLGDYECALIIKNNLYLPQKK